MQVSPSGHLNLLTFKRFFLQTLTISIKKFNTPLVYQVPLPSLELLPRLHRPSHVSLPFRRVLHFRMDAGWVLPFVMQVWR